MYLQELTKKIETADAASFDAAACREPIRQMYVDLLGRLDEAMDLCGIDKGDEEDPVVMLCHRAEAITAGITQGKCESLPDVVKLKAEYEMLDDYVRELKGNKAIR